MASVPSGFKACTKCRAVKPLESFHKNRDKPDGRRSQCKECLSVAKPKLHVKQGHRLCSACGKVKLESEFHKKKTGTNGLSRQCADCVYLRVAKWRTDNPERSAQYQRLYYKDHLEELTEKNKEYILKNPHVAAKAKKNWVERHPDRRKASSRRWRLANKERVASYAKIRRTRVKGAEGEFTEDQFQEKLTQLGGLCYWCGRSVGLDVHRDHLIPIAKGGSNDIENIVPACPDCNRRKGAKTPDEYATFNPLGGGSPVTRRLREKEKDENF